MTSSLVGSEMCIRDSPNLPELFRHNENNANCHVYAIGGKGNAIRLRICCLLYTSDAADDM
eukprot:497770-Prorocentrum_lima.AAC.1